MTFDEDGKEISEIEYCDCGNVLAPDDYLYGDICQECR